MIHKQQKNYIKKTHKKHAKIDQQEVTSPPAW